MQDLNRELANTTVLSEGETGIPILRPGVAAPRPPEKPSYSYAPASNNDEPLPPPPDTNGSPEASMQQINLASPPPPPMPSNLRNADFF